MPFTIVRQDITKMKVDAIVNAANTNLQMGGGVCGAIFKAAGVAQLQAACDKLAPIKTGDSDTLAAITGSIAEAAYGVPGWIKDKALGYLDEPLRGVYDRWESYVTSSSCICWVSFRFSILLLLYFLPLYIRHSHPFSLLVL